MRNLVQYVLKFSPGCCSAFLNKYNICKWKSKKKLERELRKLLIQELRRVDLGMVLKEPEVSTGATNIFIYI